MNDSVKKRGMKVNVSKTKVTVFERGKSTTECDILIEANCLAGSQTRAGSARRSLSRVIRIRVARGAGDVSQSVSGLIINARQVPLARHCLLAFLVKISL
ncbi:hypothetical protein EVAR_14970_1 [Eumeta japonica]|uniref:Uncharacterized protein n=1 Tax=Eumeta variegata TaxID=151549 RepID=A0A4C1XQC5_EUMVA|nr:hypothetical protein EVAR_14970_1 [Eumeta japonica]